MPSAKSGAKAGAKSKRRTTGAKGKRGGKVKLENISKAAKDLKSGMSGQLSGAELKLFSELDSLADYIQKTKTEIAELRPDEVKEDYLPTATDELDAITEATADATHSIMDATEIIEDVTETLDGEQADKLMNATTAIYEACGFQDITGQRITKVVNALKNIEEKIDALLKAFGDEIKKAKATQKTREEKKDKPLSDEDLLNGPQKNGERKTQDEIDALLANPG